MSQTTDAVTRYGAVAVGLLIGTAAKYGVAINDGEPFRWRIFIADTLMLGMLGLLAVIAGDVLSLTNQNARVFVGALAALLSARLIRIVRDKALKRAERIAEDYLGTSPPTTVHNLYQTPPSTILPQDMQDKLDKLD